MLSSRGAKCVHVFSNQNEHTTIPADFVTPNRACVFIPELALRRFLLFHRFCSFFLFRARAPFCTIRTAPVLD